MKLTAEMYPEDLLRLQARAWGIELDSSQFFALAQYADMLASYELANVIGTSDRGVIMQQHLVDALSCLLVQDLRASRKLLDVGTGGGLPGIPLGIACRGLSVILLEATEKKVRFLHTAIARLELASVKAVNARVESIGKEPGYREGFDIATARALAALPVVLEYCAPLVRTGGVVLAMKGRLSSEETSQGIAAAGALGLRLREIREVEFLPRLPQKERTLAVFDKVAETPAKFPRRVGLAKKRPLGGAP